MIHVKHAYDFQPMTDQLSARNVTDAGMVAPAVFSRSGTQQYRAGELRDGEGKMVFADKKPNDVVTLFRPSEEVLAEDSVRSFDNLPLTIEHPDPRRYPDGVTSKNWRTLAVGHAAGLKANDTAKTVVGWVHVKDANGLAVVSKGKSQLSMGYAFTLDPTSGTFEGFTYDGIQRNIRGNHIAIVDSARGGPICRIADHQKDGDETMSTKRVTVDDVAYEVEPTVATLIEKLQGERDTARTTLKDKETAHASAVVKLTADHTTALEAVKKDIIPQDKFQVMVADHADVLARVRILDKDAKTEGLATPALRKVLFAELAKKFPNVKGVGDAVLAGTKIEDASDDLVKSAVNAMSASVKTNANDAAEYDRKVAAGASAKVEDSDGSVEDKDVPEFTLDAAQRAQSNAWKGATK